MEYERDFWYKIVCNFCFWKIEDEVILCGSITQSSHKICIQPSIHPSIKQIKFDCELLTVQFELAIFVRFIGMGYLSNYIRWLSRTIHKI